jgi:tetratricopeptide (TPR) repeat protein
LIAGVLTIILLAFTVYSPVIPGSFLMDDVRLTGSDNQLLNGHYTLRSIWFELDFPLSTLGWWLEHLAFGPNPTGYHVVNILLHAISGILLWRLLVQLKIPGAWLAGALYAVHPVCVNSVARIAELKNTLSMPFFLLSYIGYLRYERARLYPSEQDSSQRSSSVATTWYTLALIAFVLSLLAKTTVVMLPVVMLLGALWQRNRISWKDIFHTAPFFILSAAFGLMSIWFQKYQALPQAEFALHHISFAERLATAGYDFWFYLGKTLLPVNLSIQYSRWTINPHAVVSYLPDVLACAVFVICLVFYRAWGRHVLFALGAFAVILFPALGFFDAEFLTLWQVSDHLQYTALAAIVALVAAGLAILLNRIVFRGIAAALILAASILCFSRAEAFRTQESIMMDTVAKDPSAWDAANDLGVVYAQKGDYAKAMDEFTLSLKYNPDDGNARMNLAHALTLEKKYADAETQYAAILKTQPHNGEALMAYADLLKVEGRNAEALNHLESAIIFEPDFETYMDVASLEYATGNSSQAVRHYRRAIGFKQDVNALNNLAWILATCPDDSVRDGKEAVADAERACQLTSYKQPAMAGTLAAAYAEAGRFPEAIAMAELAIRLSNQAGNASFAEANRQLLQLYRAGQPYHEPAR